MSNFEAAADQALIDLRTRGVHELAFHRYLGLSIELVEPGHSRVRMPAGKAAANPMGVVHGGILYAVLDVACYLAAIPLLETGCDAVTHDVHCSVLRPAPADRDVIFEGHILRAGRSLIYGESTAHVDGDLVARATVTKSRIQVNR